MTSDYKLKPITGITSLTFRLRYVAGCQQAAPENRNLEGIRKHAPLVPRSRRPCLSHDGGGALSYPKRGICEWPLSLQMRDISPLCGRGPLSSISAGLMLLDRDLFFGANATALIQSGFISLGRKSDLSDEPCYCWLPDFEVSFLDGPKPHESFPPRLETLCPEQRESRESLQGQ